MKFSTSFSSITLLILLSSLSSSLPTESPPQNEFPTVEFSGSRGNVHPIGRYNRNPKYFKHAVELTSNHNLKKRDSQNLVVSLDNQFTFYQIDLKVGTPFQTFGPAIDTGSSDLWVSASNNPFCAKNQQQIDQGFTDCSSGTFNMNKSSTFEQNNTLFSIQYQDGTFAQGVWGTDVLDIGGVTLTNSSIGIGLEANASQGVFGIGLPDLESTNQQISGPGSGHHGHGGQGGNSDSMTQNAFTYENVPQLLKIQGHINTVAYSLWLNDVNAQSGQILFGAVDHDKYIGTLQTIPLIPSIPGFSQPIEMTVVLSGVSLSDSNGDQSNVMTGSITALLDSGTSFTYLPQNVVDSISNALGAEFLQDLGYYVVNCNVQSGKTAINYNFSGANITVPLSEILFQLTDSNNNPATFNNGEPACVVGIFPSDEVILGDSFLRSAFIVYDLDNLQISIANTKYNATSSNIEAIPADGAVPSAVKAPNFSATQVFTSVQAEAATGTFSGVSGTPGPIDTGSCECFASGGRALPGPVVPRFARNY